MNSKSVAYMLVAVLVGYMLITAIPGQVEMFSTPQRTLGIESGENLTTERYEDTVNETLPHSEDDFAQAASEVAESTMGETADAARALGMISWYAFDALIAFGVYLLAKKRFS